MSSVSSVARRLPAGVRGPAQAAALARVLGALCLAGCALGALVLAFLPVPASTDRPASYALIAAVAALGGGLLAAAPRVSWRAVQVAVALGILAVSGDIAAAGSHTVDDEMLYVLPAVCAFLYSPRRLALMHLGIIGATYAAALAVAQEANGSARWVLALGALAVVWAAIDWLVGSNEAAAREATRQNAELEEAEERFRTAFDEAATGMSLGCFDGRLIRVNAAFARFLGYEQEELMALSFRDFTHPDDQDDTTRSLAALAAGRKTAITAEKRYVRKDGVVVWGVLSTTVVRGRDGRPLHYSAQIQDVTARRAAEAELAHRALHDSLTGLPNRELFRERLGEALARLTARPGVVGVFFLDLDRFKLINDGFGHPAGDAVVAEVAGRLRAILRPEDVLSRFGGDEFTVLCELPPGSDIAPMAERLVQALADPVSVAGRPVFLSASVGVASATIRGTSAEDLLTRADAAMYRAKDAGGARWEAYHYAMQTRGAERMAVEAELHEALDREQFEVHFQPIVDLETGTPVAAEALVRWRHPERGLLSPVHFVPAAEEAGLLVALGAHVLRAACQQAARWREEGHPLRVAVNLSPRQLADGDLTQLVARTLEATGLPGESLCLELSEDVVLADIDKSRAVLLELKGLGVTLSLDDFGVGSWSLSLVRRLAAIDELKIDRSWIMGLGRTAEDEAVVSAVVGVARALGLSTVAEGVETPEQAEIARRLGCSHGQGYLFARPAPAVDLEPILAAAAHGELHA